MYALLVFLLQHCPHVPDPDDTGVVDTGDTGDTDSGFCGYSSGACLSDADCFSSGCSGQVCSNEDVITTCEWRSCYDASAYGLECGCVAGLCQWD